MRRLHDEALNEVGAHLGEGLWDEDLDQVEDVYLDDGGEFLVGVYEGRVVAMGALRKTSPESAQITRMRVEPGLQGRGFGKQLLDALEKRAAELGYATLHLDTTVQQRAARRLYARNGYGENGRGKVGPFDTILYEKSLLENAS